ncbi:helix-turn-helix domain-containing protein [Pigmentiphaga sp. GD03639]|uniref:IclR family transcriptional regulator n=1 Tax=unclassified Pigmentiphaga TaxID=2626614 RepID=UPI001404FD7F|nr:MULTISPECIES: helix-turn-helix domain-containing protein [unclassified Pigmentiphaga]MDH2239451.1 helix-turn-helix domain-containing protein [Pigmentiphaga sp. GD03639]
MSAPDIPRSRGPRPFVAPLARALDVLAAFGIRDRALGNRELAARTGLPPSTVSRITRTLLALGYLLHDGPARRYRLAPAVLSLGYGAAADSNIPQAAAPRMQAFAARHDTLVTLHARDRLQMVLVGRFQPAPSSAPPLLEAGMRVGLASFPIGGTLLAALPETERYYLFEKIERRARRDWQTLRRLLGESISQVHDKGFCAGPAQWDPNLGIVSAPLAAVGQAPLVLSCIGPAARLSRIRVERELGPHLAAMSREICQSLLTP